MDKKPNKPSDSKTKQAPGKAGSAGDKKSDVKTPAKKK